MTNKFYVGLKTKIPAPKKPCLFIHDEIPDVPLARVFDPRTHSLDVFKGMTPRRARELAELLYTAVPEGQNTLTVRNGKRNLAPILRDAKSFTGALTAADDEARAMLEDLLFTPELRKPLTGANRIFKMHEHSLILARLNRAEIGDFAALVLGFILISIHNGPIIIPDFGFYGREAHINLIRENRLIAGVNFLGELPLRLRQALLLVKDRTAKGALYEDAVLLAQFRGYVQHTNEFNDYVREAMTA